MIVELRFRIFGSGSLAADHGYRLYSALAAMVPSLHGPNAIAIHPIRGRQIGNRLLEVMPWSSLAMRVSDTQIAELLLLSGKNLTLGNATLRLGVPEVHGLVPAASLRSRLVTIKSFMDSEGFQEAARRQLDALEIAPVAALRLGKRRTLRIKDKEVVGYETIIEDLSADESLRLQEHGIGGRRHMGCGVFVPARKVGDT